MALIPTKARGYVAVIGLTLLALVLTLHRLGAADVCGVNEAIEGLFVQQMVEHGALMFPLANGTDAMYKPPLFHWTSAALAYLFGVHSVTALSLRLPSALYASAGVALTVGFALSWLDLRSAVLAGLVLLSSYQYLSEGRIGRVDMALTFFEALALFSFLWWLPKKEPANGAALPAPAGAHRTELRYLFAAAIGLAVLAKGPIGALLPVFAIAVLVVVGWRQRHLPQPFSPGSAIVALGLASSWYLACLFARRFGFLDRQIGSENFGRFFGSLGAMAPTYYLKPILLNSVPASLLAPFAVSAALRSGAGGTSETQATHRQTRTGIKLLAIFWIVTVGFFSIAAYKRRAYLLPLWPPAAVLIAWWFSRLAEKGWGRIARKAAYAVFGAMVVFNLIYVPYKEVRDCAGDQVREIATQINRAVARDEPLFLYGVDETPAPLLFYLDRQVPLLHGKLDDAPPGYVIIPADLWLHRRVEAPGLEPVLTAGAGPHALILLRRGKLYAAAQARQ